MNWTMVSVDTFVSSSLPPALGGGRLFEPGYFNEVDKGGHFAAWEEPLLFASQMRAAFKSLR